MTTGVTRNLNLSQDKKFFAITFEISPFSKPVHVSDLEKQQTSPKWTEDDRFFFAHTVALRDSKRNFRICFYRTTNRAKKKRREMEIRVIA